MATLHVTARAGDHGKVEELQVVARQGPSAPSALAPARTAVHSDLGTGRSLAGLRCRGASAVGGPGPPPAPRAPPPSPPRPPAPAGGGPKRRMGPTGRGGQVPRHAP